MSRLRGSGIRWRHADIGVLTVIPTELEWTCRALGIVPASRWKSPSGTVYRHGEVSSRLASRPYRVALTCIGEAGTAECAAAVTALIRDYRPRIVILTGIAAGRRKQVKIGSVVLSERVWGYDKKAITTGKRGREVQILRPEAASLPFSVQQDITNYEASDRKDARIQRHFQAIGGTYPQLPRRISGARRNLYRAHITSGPHVLSATVASGNTLLKNPRVLYRLQRYGHGRIKVGEMEASGLVAACRQEGVPWLVVRGISDFGDKFKSDDFHRFAAQLAAAALRDFVEEGLDLAVRVRRREPKRQVEPVPSLPEMKRRIARLPNTLPTRTPPPGSTRSVILSLSKPFHCRAFRIVRRGLTSFFLGSIAERVLQRASDRWVAGDALHFALAREDAVNELLTASERNLGPGSNIVLAEFDVHLSHVLDLTDDTLRTALQIDDKLLASRNLAYQESIGESSRVARCEGILVPSRTSSRPRLVVFDRIRMDSRITFVTEHRV